jgi:hypothetical protein
MTGEAQDAPRRSLPAAGRVKSLEINMRFTAGQGAEIARTGLVFSTVRNANSGTVNGNQRAVKGHSKRQTPTNATMAFAAAITKIQRRITLMPL